MNNIDNSGCTRRASGIPESGRVCYLPRTFPPMKPKVFSSNAVT